MTAVTDRAARAALFVEHARRYSELGWALVRLDGKEPVGRRWQDATPEAPELVAGKWAVWGESRNIGVVLRGSGLAVVEPDTPEAHAKLLELLGGELPAVPIVQSGGTSLHLYFRDEGQGNGSVDGLELRADGQQCALPPSVHPATGRPYRWLEGHEPWTLPLVPVPESLVAYFAGKRRKGPASPVGDEIRERSPGRHKTLLSLAGTMRHRGMSGDEIAVALLAVNERRCKPPLLEEEVVQLARDVARRYDPAPRDVEQERLQAQAEGILEASQEALGHHREQKRRTSGLIVPLGVYLAGNEDDAAWVVDHLIGRGVLTIVAGLPKVGKSTFVFGMLGAITSSTNEDDA
jgi:hypothetical protein